MGDEWTTREKLCLASLAIKNNNSWNSVARQMQPFLEDRPDGWSNQKVCAAQFDKLMNEFGVDKRPKRNEPSDLSSGAVIYKKMVEKRIAELESNLGDLRKSFLKVLKDLEAVDSGASTKDEPSSSQTAGKQASKQEHTPQQARQSGKAKQTAASQAAGSALKSVASSKANTSLTGDIEKPPTRALTRRESSRQNLEKTFATLYKEASDIKALNQLCRPSLESERALGPYDRFVLKHVDLTTMKRRLGKDIDDPYAVMNELLLMFQNATMYYNPDHPVYKTATELREKLVPQWEKALLDRMKGRH